MGGSALVFGVWGGGGRLCVWCWGGLLFCVWMWYVFGVGSVDRLVGCAFGFFFFNPCVLIFKEIRVCASVHVCVWLCVPMFSTH